MITLTALALLIAPLGTVAGQNDDDTGMDVTVSHNEATIEFREEIGEQLATSTLHFTTNATDLNLSFAYDGVEHQLHTQLHQLVEFEDENQDGAYQAGERVASSYLLSAESENLAGDQENGTLQWGDLNVSDIEAEDGTPGKHIQATGLITTSDDPLDQLNALLGNPSNGTLVIDLYAFENATTFNGTELGPAQVKLGWTVSDYPYAENGTQLALLSTARSDQALERSTDPDADGLRAAADLEELEVDLLMEWDELASVDGTEQRVQTTEFADDGDGAQDPGDSNETRSLALSYVRGDEIGHDGLTGIEITGLGSTNFEDVQDSIPTVSALALMGAVGLAALVTTRARRDA